MIFYPAIEIENVIPDLETLAKYLGYPNSNQNGFAAQMSELLEQAKKQINISTGFSFDTKKTVILENDQLVFANISFEIGNTIKSHFVQADHLAIFVATLGKQYDEWSRHKFNSGDPFSGYIIDAIGSIAVENVVDQLEERISKLAKQDNLSCSNRFSPGYCGWDVAEQHKLFSLLPNKFCGVSLNNSALMNPIKSVSGIIGVGANLKWQAYSCIDCPNKKCIKQKI